MKEKSLKNFDWLKNWLKKFGTNRSQIRMSYPDLSIPDES